MVDVEARRAADRERQRRFRARKTEGVPAPDELLMADGAVARFEREAVVVWIDHPTVESRARVFSRSCGLCGTRFEFTSGAGRSRRANVTCYRCHQCRADGAVREVAQ